jgi:hypothetical protein
MSTDDDYEVNQIRPGWMMNSNQTRPRPFALIDLCFVLIDEKPSSPENPEWMDNGRF